jgi:hypothetical protein
MVQFKTGQEFLVDEQWHEFAIKKLLPARHLSSQKSRERAASAKARSE